MVKFDIGIFKHLITKFLKITQDNDELALDIESSAGAANGVQIAVNNDNSWYSIRTLHGASIQWGIRRVDAVTIGVCMLISSYYFWVDSTGDFRIKNGIPTSDTDGTIIGTQS